MQVAEQDFASVFCDDWDLEKISYLHHELAAISSLASHSKTTKRSVSKPIRIPNSNYNSKESTCAVPVMLSEIDESIINKIYGNASMQNKVSSDSNVIEFDFSDVFDY